MLLSDKKTTTLQAMLKVSTCSLWSPDHMLCTPDIVNSFKMCQIPTNLTYLKTQKHFKISLISD